MKLRFKHQKFQEDATNAICDVFAGQSNVTRKFLLDQGESSSTARSLLEIQKPVGRIQKFIYVKKTC